MRLSFNDTYATDVFPFIKSGGMTASISAADLAKSAREYGLPQIGIVRPKMVLCLGSAPFNALRRAMNKAQIKLSRAYQVENPLHTEFDGIPIFGVAHPGGLGSAAVGGEKITAPRWASLGEHFRSLVNGGCLQ